MVRITAIKINLLYIKLMLLLILSISIFAVIKSLLIPNVTYSSIVQKVSIDFFKKAIADTIILKEHNNSENIFDVKINIGDITEYIMGFSIKKPESIITCQMPFISHYEQLASAIPESMMDIDENNQIIVHEQANTNSKGEETTAEPEIKPKELVTKASGITLINETNYNIDLASIINSPIKINQKKGDPVVLIYHTHTCESYYPSPKYKYTPSDNDRTEDLNFNVARVGEKVAGVLKNQYGISTIHDKTVHDRDYYNRAYSKSEKTLQGYIKKYPSIVAIDIHRDAADINGKKLKVSTSIRGEQAAQAMIVIGTDGRGLSHPNWRENLKLGVKLTHKMNELYPGLSRGINIKLGRFNQFLSPNSILIEIGSNGNTLDEALNSTQYIARVIAEVLNEAK